MAVAAHRITTVNHRPSESTGHLRQVSCGWCGRYLASEPGEGARHVTCDECRQETTLALA